jgi:hypothetical protein
MTGKPFRPPLLRRIEKPAVSVYQHGDEPQAKKRRISNSDEDIVKLNTPQLVFKQPGISSLPRKPLAAVENPAVAALVPATQLFDGGVESYYNVLW